MDPITLMAIGAALGIGKNELFDKPQAAKMRNYQAAVAKFSPWTRMDAGKPTIAPSDFDSGLQGGVTGLAIGAQLPKGSDAAAGAAQAAQGSQGMAYGGGGMLTDGPTSTGSATGDFLGGGQTTSDYLSGVQPAPNPSQAAPMAFDYGGSPTAPADGFRAARMRTPSGYPGYFPGMSPWMGAR